MIFYWLVEQNSIPSWRYDMWLQGQASLVAEMCRSNDRLSKMTTEDGDPQLGIFSGRSQFDTKVSERLAEGG